MAGAASAGVKPIVRMTRNPFIQGSETTIVGQQAEDVTEYSSEHSKDALTAAQLSKMEQIVEYLKVLYR